MYLITPDTFEELTLNAPYPSCQAKRLSCSFIHFDELDLMSVTALTKDNVGGKRNRRWTWSAMPLIENASMSWFLQMPAMYGHSRAWVSLGMSFSRFFVLKTQWT